MCVEKKKGLGPFGSFDLLMETLQWSLPMAREEHAISIHGDKLNPGKGGEEGKRHFCNNRKK